MILAIDTSTSSGGVALFEDDNLLGEHFISVFQARSERLIPDCVALFDAVDRDLEDLAGIAVTIGPGSYTGVRIGVTAAKVLGYILKCPLVGISTIDVLALGVRALAGEKICPIIAAKRGNVYWALYDAQDVSANGSCDIGLGDLLALPDRCVIKTTDIRISNIDELLRNLPDIPGNILFTGDGVSDNWQKIRAHLGRRAIKVSGTYRKPRAAILAELGLLRMKRGEATDAFHLEPYYHRRPDAEVKWEAKISGQRACGRAPGEDPRHEG